MLSSLDGQVLLAGHLLGFQHKFCALPSVHRNPVALLAPDARVVVNFRGPYANLGWICFQNFEPPRGGVGEWIRDIPSSVRMQKEELALGAVASAPEGDYCTVYIVMQAQLLKTARVAVFVEDSEVFGNLSRINHDGVRVLFHFLGIILGMLE